MIHDISRLGRMATSSRKGLEALLRDIGVEDPFDTGEEIGGRCPRHAERTGARESRIDHWSVNARTGVHYCFSCGYSGNLRQLVEDLTKKSMWDALTMLREYGIELDPNAEPEEIVPTVAEESSLDIFSDEIPVGVRRQHSLTTKALAVYGVRWAAEERELIFPVRLPDGTLIGRQRKPTSGEGEPRFSLGTRPSVTLFGLAELLAARVAGEVKPGDRVLLVESARDVIYLRSLGWWAVASWTAHLSPAQLDLLAEHLAGLEVAEALDNDPAGRDGAAALRKAWDGPEWSLTSFQYPAGTEDLDPGDLDTDQIRAGITAATVVSTWENPTPLPGSGFGGFWQGNLGDLGDAFVAAVAGQNASPPDLAGLAVLGATSAVISGGVQVRGSDGWVEGVNLYLLGIAAPGESKSPTLAEVIRPLTEIERERRERAAPEIAAATSRKSVAEKTLALAETAASKASIEDAAAMTEEAAQRAQEAARLEVPALPRLFTRDATPESLVAELGRQKGRLAVITDEAGDFLSMASRYQQKGAANLGIYLAGWDGQRYVSDRVGRDTIDIPSVTMTTLLFGQPAVLEQMGQDRQAAGRGLFARFLPSRPQSLVGNRPTHRAAVSDELKESWASLLKALAADAEGITAPVMLTLDWRAKGLFDTWREAHERRLRPVEGDLTAIADWGNKLPGEALRLAGNIHALRTGRVRAGFINGDTMGAALGLADYFTSHALVVFGQMSADPATQDAVIILNWIRAKDLKEVSTREISRSKSWAPDRVRPAMRVLTEFGWTQVSTAERKGGRPSERWQVTPHISKDSPAKTCQKSPLLDVSAPSGPRSADVVPIRPSAGPESKKTPPAPRKFRPRVAAK